ncbi:DNA polymerase II [Escherichia coli]|uniref:DNA-directed DNA polymerase n=1 Tax=Escherichia coli TaxID=562 RepID=A0A2X3KJ95_ECOLX|nr:DNA polymerase II [Escherichia coli]
MKPKRQGNKTTFAGAEDHYECLFMACLAPPPAAFSIPRLASSITMRGHQIMRQTKALIEAQGYDVIYGDTDSTFVWLKGAHSKKRRRKSVVYWCSTLTPGGRKRCKNNG